MILFYFRRRAEGNRTKLHFSHDPVNGVDWAGETALGAVWSTTESGLTSGDGTDRVNLVGNPFAVASPSSGTSVVYLNKAAFALPAAGTYGNLGRNAIYGPGFFSIDPSLFKTFRITERFSLQFRAEMFNALNWANLANPTATLTSASFGLIGNTKNGSIAPGLGFGEPRNTQLALKLIF